MHFPRYCSLTLGVLLAFGAPLGAGWRVPQGLGVMLRGAKKIAVYEIETVNAKKRVITFQKVKDIRPKLSPRFRLYVTREGEVDHRAPPGQDASEWLLRWARPGRRVVSFNHQEVYVGGYWLQMWLVREGENPYYKLTEWHAMFGYTFAGSIDELAQACRDILAGKQAVVPVFASTPFVRESVLTHWRGKFKELPLARLKADLTITRIPEHRLRHPFDRDAPEWRLVVGPGSGRVVRLPELRKQLRDPDPEVRAEAARQIGGIGPGAKDALPQLAHLLDDGRVTVRTAAAGAVLQLDPKHVRARRALRKAAQDAAPTVRQSAAEWLWILDRDVEGTVADLVKLQRDPAPAVRATATGALKSFLTAYDPKGLTKDDLRRACESPDKECARLAAKELARHKRVKR
jgi:hypothetical protein